MIFFLPLNSSIVNMQMVREDFVRFCKNQKKYLMIPLDEVKYIDRFYSVGGADIDFSVEKLGDIYLYLQHY